MSISRKGPSLGRGEALGHLIPGTDRPIPDRSSRVPNDRCGCLHPNPTLGQEQPEQHKWQIPEKGSASRTEQEKGQGRRRGASDLEQSLACPPGPHTPSKSQRKKPRSFLTLKLSSHIHQSHIKCLVIQ